MTNVILSLFILKIIELKKVVANFMMKESYLMLSRYNIVLLPISQKGIPQLIYIRTHIFLGVFFFEQSKRGCYSDNKQIGCLPTSSRDLELSSVRVRYLVQV